jgi:hypothetical protein
MILPVVASFVQLATETTDGCKQMAAWDMQHLGLVFAGISHFSMVVEHRVS